MGDLALIQIMKLEDTSLNFSQQIEKGLPITKETKTLTNTTST